MVGQAAVGALPDVEADGDRGLAPGLLLADPQAQVERLRVAHRLDLAHDAVALRDDAAAVRVPLPVAAVQHDDGPLLARLCRDDAEVLLVGEVVAPELTPIAGQLEVDRVPRELEPLVDPGEEDAGGKALLLDVAEHVGVHAHRLLLGVVALATPDRSVVSNPERARHAELGDRHRLIAVVLPQRVQVAGVRVDLAVARALVVLVALAEPHEVGVVRIGVVAGEEAAGPLVGRADVGGVDRDEVLLLQRLLGVLERVDGQPVRERQRPAPSTLGVALGGVVEHRGEPALHRRRLAGGPDVLALVRALAGVLLVGRLDRVGVPLDADREGEQPARHVGGVLAAGMPADARGCRRRRGRRRRRP